jgi:hypothetical protein
LGLPAGAGQVFGLAVALTVLQTEDSGPTVGDADIQQLGLPAGAGQVVGLAVALTVLQAKDLGIMCFYLADLIHELQLMNPAHSLQ